MTFRDNRPWALSAATIAAIGLFLAPASAGEIAPFRAPLARSFPPIVQQFGRKSASNAQADKGSLFAPARAAVVRRLESATVPTTDADAVTVDVADALISSDQRALASTIESWISAPLEGANGAERRRRRAAIAAFYALRNYQPLWRDGETWRPEAAALAQRLREAGEDGLDLRSYPIPAVEHGPAAASAELDLSEAIAGYAAQASGARVDPQKLSRLIDARPPLPEPGAILAAVAAGGARAGEILQDFNPPHPGYRALRAKLAELRSSRASGELRVADAGAVLTRNDGFPAPSGRRQTASTTKRSSARVEAEIIANMERWRWMPRQLGDTRIEVNVPDFELALVRNGAIAHRARVIVGKEGTPTPIFSNRMRFIIVNPYWNVPPSILNKEMLPKYSGDLSTLEQEGFDVSFRNGRLSVRQRPGERNALGRIKFMFPNDFSVYLHDTPSHALFAQSHRAFSHGCVRVEQPFRLAEMVLGPGSGWPEERVRRLVGGSERYLNLARPLPIHIEYFTAFIDENGRLQLRDDLYGYSARVRAALGLEG